MADPNDVYRNQFNNDQLNRFDDEFERGIRDDDNHDNDINHHHSQTKNMLVIKTPGVQKRGAAEFTKPIFGDNFPKIFSFSMNTTTRINDPPLRRPPRTASATRKKKKSARDSDFAISNTEEDDGVADNTEPRMPFSRPQRQRNVDVASKEVIEDGGAAAAPPMKFVSVNSASRSQSRRNVDMLIEENNDLCDSSCDELERRIAELDEEEDRKNRNLFMSQYVASKKSGRVPRDGVAPESMEELSVSGAGSTEKRRKRPHVCSDDDENDDEDMYYSASDRISSNVPKKRYKGPDDSSSKQSSPHRSANHATSNSAHKARRTFAGGGGDDDDDGANSKVKQRDYRPGRSVSSSMNCFLCRHGDRHTDSVSRHDMVKLLKMLDDGVGHSDPVCLARTVHLQYMNTIFKDGRLGGHRPPVWRTKHVLEHILYHDDDPRYFVWLSIMRAKRNIDCLSETSYIEHPVNKANVPSKSLELQMKAEDHLLKLYNCQPEKMNFYNASAQIDLGKNNRRVRGLTQKRAPKHYAHSYVAEVDEH